MGEDKATKDFFESIKDKEVWGLASAVNIYLDSYTYDRANSLAIVYGARVVVDWKKVLEL